MLVYKLKLKNTEPVFDDYYRIKHFSKLKCTLFIEEGYLIERYEDRKHLYYVHFKDSKIVKICCYEKI